MDLVEVVMKGQSLAPGAVAALEHRLQVEPNDAETRARLLGYYFLHAPPGHLDRRKYREHALWFIRRAPRSDVAGSGFVRLDVDDGSRAPEAAQSAWRRHLRNAPNDLL